MKPLHPRLAGKAVALHLFLTYGPSRALHSCHSERSEESAAEFRISSAKNLFYRDERPFAVLILRHEGPG
jgi:hypothetical protein